MLPWSYGFRISYLYFLFCQDSADKVGNKPVFGPVASADNISGASVAETILVGKAACHACVIACGRVVRLEDGGTMVKCTVPLRGAE